MKDHPDINDTLKTEGPDAVRARHDKAHQKARGKKQPNGQDQTAKQDKADDDCLPMLDVSAWDGVAGAAARLGGAEIASCGEPSRC